MKETQEKLAEKVSSNTAEPWRGQSNPQKIENLLQLQNPLSQPKVSDERTEEGSALRFETSGKNTQQSGIQKFFAFFVGIYNGIRDFISSIGKKETVEKGVLDTSPSGPVSASSVQSMTNIEKHEKKAASRLAGAAENRAERRNEAPGSGPGK